MLLVGLRVGLCLGLPLRLGCRHARAMCSTTASLSSTAGPLLIEQVPALNDNYALLVSDPVSGETAAVDTPEVAPIREALERRGWKLTTIINTHHHADHTGGNGHLKQETSCTVIAPAAEAKRIPTMDRGVSGGDVFSLGEHEGVILDVGGHTAGHIAYYLPTAGAVFVGDALFSMGCGRLFEGTPRQAWESLCRLSALPPTTAVYCAHEYTEANLRFALSVEPGNQALQRRAEEVRRLRANGQPTVPTTIGRELETNPFLRAHSGEIRERLGMEGESDLDVFTRLRQMKDNF